MSKLAEVHCQSCGHNWTPRKNKIPSVCPNCGTSHWATGRRRPPIEQQRQQAAVRRKALKKLEALGVKQGSASDSDKERADDPVRNAQRITVSGGVLVPQSELVTLWQLPRVPCGPWEEALNEAEAYPIPKSLAAILGARNGDWLVPCNGQSMREAGLPDGGMAVMRPLMGATPSDGAIVLCCVERESGQWLSTIKFWYPGKNGGVDLRDGKLQPYHLPTDAKDVHIVAGLVGLMGQATQGTQTIKGQRIPKDRVRSSFDGDEYDPLNE